jgi:hypothetical protein
VYQIPVQPFDPPVGLGLSRAHGRPVDDYGVTYQDFTLQVLRTTEFLDQLAHRTDARIFKPDSILCDQNVCHSYAASLGSLYFNADHIGLVGARLLVKSFPMDELTRPAVVLSANPNSP